MVTADKAPLINSVSSSLKPARTHHPYQLAGGSIQMPAFQVMSGFVVARIEMRSASAEQKIISGWRYEMLYRADINARGFGWK